MSVEAAVGTATHDAPGRRRLHQQLKLSPELRHRLRIWAAVLDTEISSVAEQAIAKHLDALETEWRRTHEAGPLDVLLGRDAGARGRAPDRVAGPRGTARGRGKEER